MELRPVEQPELMEALQNLRRVYLEASQWIFYRVGIAGSAEGMDRNLQKPPLGPEDIRPSPMHHLALQSSIFDELKRRREVWSAEPVETGVRYWLTEIEKRI